MLIDAEMRAFVRSPLRSLAHSFGIKQTGAIDYERTRSRRRAMHEQVRRARIQSDSTGTRGGELKGPKYKGPVTRDTWDIV